MLPPSTSEPGEEPKPPTSKLPEPDLKALALLLEKEDATLPSMIDMADSSVFWRLNTDTAALMLRDKLIVEVKLLLVESLICSSPSYRKSLSHIFNLGLHTKT